MLKLFSLACSGYDGDEDRDEFVRFLQEEVDSVAGNMAVLVKQLQPQLGFVCFLKKPIQLGAKLC